jgi:hypothetical protein
MTYKTGRPRKFDTKEQLQVKIDEYFDVKCKDEALKDPATGETLYDKQGRPCVKYNPPTMDGMALYVGFSDRSSLYEYEKEEEFSDTIKRARARIADYAQSQLFVGNSTGAIFWLKNHGWKDSKEITGDGVPVKIDKGMSPEEAALAYQNLLKIDK